MDSPYHFIAADRQSPPQIGDFVDKGLLQPFIGVSSVAKQ
jgi:hypothetical protein